MLDALRPSPAVAAAARHARRGLAVGRRDPGRRSAPVCSSSGSPSRPRASCARWRRSSAARRPSRRRRPAGWRRRTPPATRADGRDGGSADDRPGAGDGRRHSRRAACSPRPRTPTSRPSAPTTCSSRETAASRSPRGRERRSPACRASRRRRASATTPARRSADASTCRHRAPCARSSGLPLRLGERILAEMLSSLGPGRRGHHGRASPRSKTSASAHRISMTTPPARRCVLTVTGIYEPPQQSTRCSATSYHAAAFDRAFPRPRTSTSSSRRARDERGTGGEARPSPRSRTRRRATVDVVARSAVKDIGDILNLLYVLLALSVIVSLFGMVNTLVLSVFERTREIGMLRAVGMTRRQIRRMVRHESVDHGADRRRARAPARARARLARRSGAGAVRLRRSRSRSARLRSSWSWRSSPACSRRSLPARRAARLNVLEALQYE